MYRNKSLCLSCWLMFHYEILIREIKALFWFGWRRAFTFFGGFFCPHEKTWKKCWQILDWRTASAAWICELIIRHILLRSEERNKASLSHCYSNLLWWKQLNLFSSSDKLITRHHLYHCILQFLPKFCS